MELELKYEPVAYMIYAAMAMYLLAAVAFIVAALAAYLLAAAAFIVRVRQVAWGLYGLGFAAAVAAWFYRWDTVGHVPLQNMFEVFLCLGMLLMPITLFCRKFLSVGCEAFDAVLGVLILFPAGLVFHSETQRLPPALQSFLFFPHVSAYMLSYIILAKALAPAAMRLFIARPKNETLVPHDVAAHRMTALGFPLLTLGLVLGAVWGKIAWGDYWNWDPKELWSFISWLVFLGYFHFRHLYGMRFPRISSVFVIAGLVAIALTLIWVNLARIFSTGMHSYAS